MFKIRLDLDKISAKTQKHQLFNNEKHEKNAVPNQGENWWRLS